MPSRLVCWALLLLLVRGMGVEVCAERASNWRMFKTADGLQDNFSAAVTVSPLGHVWVKHGDASDISVYDGYSIRTMPSPGRDFFRVYESRTGHLWSIYPDGLVVYAMGQWVNHPIPEIRAELQSRPVRQIPLLPAEHDRILILLSDKLLEYDASSHKATLLKTVAETRLGRFSEMAEARDGGLWITGARGAAKLAGTRPFSPETPVEIYLADEALHAENFQHPFEDAAGTLTLAAADSRPNGQHLILRLQDGIWRELVREPVNMRQAWPGWDGSIWAYAVSSLLRLDPPPSGTLVREKIWAGQFKDVAIDSNHGFWLATSEGLLRYAPFLWRTPIALEDINSHVHGILQDGQGRYWMASGDYLLRWDGGPTRAIKWPEGVEGTFEPGDTLYRLRDGRLAVRAAERVLLFDPATEQFEPLAHPSGQKLRLVGQFPSGDLILQLGAATAEEHPGFELIRFGEGGFEPFTRSPPTWTFGADLFCVAQLVNGDVWIGGTGGLARLRHDTWELFGTAQGFRETKALVVAEVGGKLWCGGPTKILEFNGKSWSVVRPGLDRVNAIVPGTDDKTWVATAGGLLSFSTANSSWVQHGLTEGLPSPGISSLFLDRDHRLWAGTTRGVSCYHPNADIFPPRTLAPTLENSKDGEVTGETTVVLLNAVDKWQHTPGDRLLFSTRLDDAAWTPFTNSMVCTFPRLGAGKHRLAARAMDVNWNEDPLGAEVDFSVVVAWYRDPRVLGSVLSGTVLVVLFAGLAVNRHLRLIRSYAEVERIVALRTRELERANEELFQSQKMKALGTLAAGIAHDFNNILSIIKGSAQIIQANPEDTPKILTRVNRIQAVVEQGSSIVRSMLGLSRVKEKDFAVADLNQLVEEGIRLMGDRFLQETTLSLNPAAGLPPVPVVKELLQQMLLNLILNAADAMDQRGEIKISTGRLDHVPLDLALSPAIASSYVYVSVQDTGCGIAPDVLRRIFEPFFTTKALSARRGTGLGLSVVYELARQMGYGLEVRSTLGKGSTFSIIVPCGQP